MRSKYYLAYAAYGLSCGVRDSSQLLEYGKREMLRYRRHRIVPRGSITEAGESSSSREREGAILQSIPNTGTSQIEDTTEHNQSDEPPTKRSRLTEHDD